MNHREEFQKMMCAKDIALSLRVYGHITESVEYDITNAKSREDANGHLFTFLTEKASEQQVQGTFKFASEKKDYGRMSQFATTILQQLPQGHSVVFTHIYYISECVYPRHVGTNVLYKRQCLVFPFISSCIMQVSVNCWLATCYIIAL